MVSTNGNFRQAWCMKGLLVLVYTSNFFCSPYMNLFNNYHRVYSWEGAIMQEKKRSLKEKKMGSANKLLLRIKLSGKFSFSAVSNQNYPRAGDLLIVRPFHFPEAVFYRGTRLPLQTFSVKSRHMQLGNSGCDKSMSTSWWISLSHLLQESVHYTLSTSFGWLDILKTTVPLPHWNSCWILHFFSKKENICTVYSCCWPDHNIRNHENLPIDAPRPSSYPKQIILIHFILLLATPACKVHALPDSHSHTYTNSQLATEEEKEKNKKKYIFPFPFTNRSTNFSQETKALAKDPFLDMIMLLIDSHHSKN